MLSAMMSEERAEAERQTTQKRVRLWSNCKAKAGSENFCEYCGSSLKRQ